MPTRTTVGPPVSAMSTGLEDNTHAPAPGSHFYRRWVLACATGELIGIGAAVAAALLLSAAVGEPRSAATRVLVLATFGLVGVAEGGALAALEWRVLRARLPRLRAGEWIGVTVAIAVAGWLLGMAPSTFSSAPDEVRSAAEPPAWMVVLLAAGAGAVAGLCFGGAQWLVLRRHATRAGRWVWIHLPAWALAMAAIFLGATVPTSQWPRWATGVAGAAGGLLGGALLGAVTGLVARTLTPWVDETGWSLRGKVCAVTGANAGIGYETVLGLSRLGATVVLLCRRPSEGQRAREAILAARPDADVAVVPCDVGDFGSIRTAAAELLTGWARLDVLVHDAGATFPTRTTTRDGVEATLAVDVVGPFLLTALLRERLEACAARVITLTGIYQRKGTVDLGDLHFARRRYDWLTANNQAQRARLLFTAELARRAPRLTVASVHPGAVLTRAQVHLPTLARIWVHTVMRPGFVRAEVGAIPVIRLAADPCLQNISGRFFVGCRLAPDAPPPSESAAFWTACTEMTKIAGLPTHAFC